MLSQGRTNKGKTVPMKSGHIYKPQPTCRHKTTQHITIGRSLLSISVEQIQCLPALLMQAAQQLLHMTWNKN